MKQVCWYFNRFYNDLAMNGPRGVIRLISDFGTDARTGTIAIAAEGVAKPEVLDAVTALVAFVGSSRWPGNGSIVSPEVTRVQDLCS